MTCTHYKQYGLCKTLRLAWAVAGAGHTIDSTRYNKCKVPPARRPTIRKEFEISDRNFENLGSQKWGGMRYSGELLKRLGRPKNAGPVAEGRRGPKLVLPFVLEKKTLFERRGEKSRQSALVKGG
jgi:hypothetical protein